MASMKSCKREQRNLAWKIEFVSGLVNIISRGGDLNLLRTNALGISLCCCCCCVYTLASLLLRQVRVARF